MIPTEVGRTTLRDARGRDGWWWAEDAVFDMSVSGYAKLIYAYLCRRANAEQVSWPSVRDIGRGTGWSASTVKRALQELTTVGAVTVAESGKTVGTANLYRIMSVRGLGRSDRATQGLSEPVGVGQAEPGVAQTEPGVGQTEPPGRSVGATEGLESIETRKEESLDRPPLAVVLSPYQIVMERYVKLFKARHGGEPPVITARDGQQLKQLLTRWQDAGKVCAFLTRWFGSPDPWYAKAGFSLGMFCSSTTLNKLLSEVNAGVGRAGAVLSGLLDVNDEGPGRG